MRWTHEATGETPFHSRKLTDSRDGRAIIDFADTIIGSAEKEGVRPELQTPAGRAAMLVNIKENLQNPSAESRHYHLVLQGDMPVAAVSVGVLMADDHVSKLRRAKHVLARRVPGLSAPQALVRDERGGLIRAPFEVGVSPDAKIDIGGRLNLGAMAYRTALAPWGHDKDATVQFTTLRANPQPPVNLSRIASSPSAGSWQF